MSFTSQYLPCAGLEIHYTDWGKAEKGTVIAWHGLARTGRDMDERYKETSLGGLSVALPEC